MKKMIVFLPTVRLFFSSKFTRGKNKNLNVMKVLVSLKPNKLIHLNSHITLYLPFNEKKCRSVFCLFFDEDIHIFWKIKTPLSDYKSK